jgi:hypothetical protein
MKKFYLSCNPISITLFCLLLIFFVTSLPAQTPSFPGAMGFIRFAKEASGVSSREAYVVTNFNDASPGSFRDAVRDGETATGDIRSFTVVDTVPPTVITRNINVTLDNNGIALVQPADIDNGSHDDYGIKSMSIDKNVFHCFVVGPNTVTLTVTDNNNNVATGTAIVTVIGKTPNPRVTITRDDNTYTGGNASTIYFGYGAQQLTFNAIDSGSTSSTFRWTPARNLSNATISNPVFTPTLAGHYGYTLTATNSFGCAATTTVSVEVIDVRCGWNNANVKVCFHGLELCLPKPAIPLLLQLGFNLGECDGMTAGRGITPQSFNDRDLKGLKFFAYPNPANDRITLLFATPASGKYSIELYNAQGALVRPVEKGQANGLQSLELNTRQLPQGLYLIKLITNAGVQVKRIVIQH